MSKDSWIGEQRLHLRRAALVAMQLHASGQDAEAQIREMCRGEMPRVGQRFVWVCTGLTVADASIQVSFQLTPLDEEEQAQAGTPQEDTTLLWVVVAWSGSGAARQITLCGAYRTEEDAMQHIVEARALNPHLTFDRRICPFPTPQEAPPAERQR
jgi:hypothetical protein